MAFELIALTAVQGYHIYKDSTGTLWLRTYIETQTTYVLGHLPNEFSWVAFLAVWSTLWSVHIGQVGGRWVICSHIHLPLVFYRVHNKRSKIEALIYMLASCVELIKRQVTRNKDCFATWGHFLWQNMGMPFLSSKSCDVMWRILENLKFISN